MRLRLHELVEIGEKLLEEAVFSVLLEATNQGKSLSISEISRRTGIFRDALRQKGFNFNDAIVMGILVKLCKEGLVDRAEKQEGWQLTEKGLGQTSVEITDLN